jgi:hypothetical protein
MRFLLFFSAIAVLALGFAATRVLGREAGLGFLTGALTLGGGFAISALFSLRWRWHGILGAGVLALLGVASGLGNVFALFQYLAGNRENGPRPLLESAVTLTCLLLLTGVVRTLFAERRRRLLEASSSSGE